MNATRSFSPSHLNHQHVRPCGHAPHAQQALDRALHRAMGFSTIH